MYTKRQVLLFISETVCWALVIVFSLFSISSMQVADETIKTDNLFVALMLFAYAVVYIHRAITHRHNKLEYIPDLASALLVATLGVLTLIFLGYESFQVVLGVSFFSILLLRRIPRIIEKHKPRDLVLQILIIIALIGSGAISLIPAGGILYLLFAVMILSVFQIIGVAFSRIRLKVIVKIMRKTFVPEIVFGLVTLIIVFSFVFFIFEPGFNYYGDALWYCFAVVTTIGFGDLTATTVFGRVLSVILAIYGIIVTAAFTSVIVNFYMETAGSNSAEKNEGEGKETGKEEPKEIPEKVEESKEEPKDETKK